MIMLLTIDLLQCCSGSTPEMTAPILAEVAGIFAASMLLWLNAGDDTEESTAVIRLARPASMLLRLNAGDD